MTNGAAIDLLVATLLVTIKVAGPMLLASLVAGLVIGVLQAATQVNEMSIAFMVKLVAVGVTFVFLAGWTLNQLIDHTRHSIESIATVVR